MARHIPTTAKKKLQAVPQKRGEYICDSCRNAFSGLYIEGGIHCHGTHRPPQCFCKCNLKVYGRAGVTCWIKGCLKQKIKRTPYGQLCDTHLYEIVKITEKEYPYLRWYLNLYSIGDLKIEKIQTKEEKAAALEAEKRRIIKDFRKTLTAIQNA